MKNKKANFLDIFGVLEILTIILMMGLFTYVVMDALGTGFSAVPEDVIPNATSATVQEVADRYPFWIDMLFGGFLAGLFGFSIFAARLVPSSPKLILVAIVFLIGGAMFGALVEQIWYPFTQNSFLATYINQMTIAPFIMDNFMLVTIFFMTAVSIALLAKEERGFLQ